MDFIEKLQNKSEREKKIIIWTVLIVIGLILLLLWVYNSKRNIGSLKTEDIIEQIELPAEAEEDIRKAKESTTEDLKELEELLNQLEQESLKQENAQ